ncbi:hypothetical protein SUGI_0692180 [Cryptomeria japonica]|nr:hypothetical protein SUGI_0692180 [Cryptomeria japonica]
MDNLWDKCPDHLLEMILARLPVTDCVRLYSVCKKWKSLCSIAQFISLQAQFSSPILLELQQNWTLSSVETYSMGSSDRKTGVIKPIMFKKLKGSLCSRIKKLVAYGDGFLLFSIRNNCGHGFFIWNPLPDHTKIIPPPCSMSPISSTAVLFDKKSQCCKIVIVQQKEDEVETWIYNSNKDEWKQILLPQEASS